MPRPRLPWGKFWWELVDHPKFAELEDGERWTWVEVWAKSAMLPKRWEYASVRHAAKVSGRPEAHIRRLVEVRLLDQRADGSLIVHDARQWQEWKGGPADEIADAETPAKPPRNPAETPANGRSNPAETPLETLKKSRELRIEREDETPGLASAHAGTHEADPEDEVSRWLAEDERPGDEPESALSQEDEPAPFVTDDTPGVIVKLTPIDERVRAKKRAASDDDIRELDHHFEPAFKRELEPLGVDWQQAYRRAWQSTVVQYEGASAQDLNDWLHQRLEQAKARAGVPPPSVAAMARAATATIDPYAAIEIRASA